MVSAAFPKVLDALQLQAFDLSKIVQPFVKHMPGLPLELKRHLFWIEERIIESLAWERGSRLYDVLAATHVSSNSAVLQRSAACKPSMPQLSQGHAVAAQEAPTAPAQGDGEATASHALSMGRMKISSPDHQANGQTTKQPPSQQATVGGPPGSLTLQPECSSLGGTLFAGVPASPKRTPDLASFVSPAKRVRSHEGTVSSLAAQSSPAQGGAVSAPSDPGAQGLSHATCSLGQRSAAACDTLPPQPAKASGWQASPDTPPTCCALQPLPAGVGQPLTAAALAAMPPSAASALSVTHDFLRKALKLAWFRLGWLCQALSALPLPLSPAELRQRVYDTVEHALYQHTCLLYNRHLDQIVLCALYGYCKVHKMANISFKEIIVHYRRQPQASQTVFRSVVLKQSLPELQVLARGDIIAFYNQLFVPLMKQFLLRDGGTAPTGLPPIPPPCAALPSQQMLRGSPARHPPPMPGTGAPSVPSPCPAHPKTAPRPPLAASPLGLPPSHPTPTKQLPGNSLMRLSPRTGVGMLQPAQGPGAAPAALAAGDPVSGPDRTQQAGQLVQTVTGFFPALSSASGSGQQVQGQGQAVKVVIAERRQVIKAALRGLVEAAQPDLSPAEVDAVVAEVNKRMTMGSKQCVLAAVMSLTVLLLSFLGQPTPGFPAAAGPAPGPPPPPDPDHPPYAHPRIPTRISPRTAAAPAQLPPPVQLGIWDPQLLAQIRDAMELIAKVSVIEHMMRGPHHHGIRLLPGEVAAFEQPSSAWPVAMLQQLDEEHLTGDGNSLNANATTIITSIQEFYRHPGRFIRWWCKAVGVVEEGFSRAMKKHFPQLVLGRLDYSLPDRQHKWRLPANSMLRQPCICRLGQWARPTSDGQQATHVTPQFLINQPNR
ncbi:hypothetical protein QJQ45_006424 [Haematococcus lacustris]|nr:hypothetical protein QJQ45_006424 [Haematococcus lacustris]